MPKFKFHGKIPGHTIKLPVSGAEIEVPASYGYFTIEADMVDAAKALIEDDFFDFQLVK